VIQLYGYAGTILRINLSNDKIVKEPLSMDFARKYIGGSGFNARVLYDNVGPNVDPFSPDNLFMVGIGALSGTLAPCCSRVTFTARSPQTGIFGDANSGGDFGSTVKFAGYDQIVVEGKAKKPVYIWIDDDNVEIRNGEHLWGKDTWETDQIIKDEHGDEEIRTAITGPAGENKVLMASIIVQRYRAAARTGLGAVMGSKNLKAIAVRGTKAVQIAKVDEFESLANESVLSIMGHHSYKRFATYGTLDQIASYNDMGLARVKNGTEHHLENLEDITAETLEKKYKVRSMACFACPIHCTHFHSIEEGKFAGTMGGKPELTAAEAFGTNVGNSDLASICYLQDLSNRLAIDIHELGDVIGMSMEWYEKGIITKEQTGGIELTWGNVDAMIQITEKIANVEGFGRILAKGVKGACEAMSLTYPRPGHIKGLGMTYKDLRGGKSWALAYAVNPRGADHLKGYPVFEAVGDRETAKKFFGSENIVVPYSDDPAKGPMVKWHEDFIQVLASTGLCVLECLFLFESVSAKMIAGMMSAATGWDMSEQELLRAGERNYHLMKCYNMRLGLTSKDDTIPEYFLKEPVSDGPAKGQVVRLDVMKRAYYKARGWDVKKGVPSREKLVELDLKDVADDLEKRGVLPKS